MVFSPAIADTSIGQTSFWPNSTTPDTPQVTSTSPVTLGLKFYSDVPGYVTGIQFYKGTGNTGAHVGALWSNTGANLASVTFAGETASGWQQANFSSGRQHCSKHDIRDLLSAPNGGHAHDQNYPWSALSAGSLHVTGSSPGVFHTDRVSCFL